MANKKDNNKKSTTKAKRNKLDGVQITKADEALFKEIGKHESYGGDPNTLYAGYKENPEKPLTEMTINEVLELQEKMKDSGSSAVGAHQFLQGTLKEEMKAAGLSGNELFSHDLQNKLMKHRLVRVRDYDDFLSGDIPPEKFAWNLSQEFASMPVPYDGVTHDKREVKKGQSYYAGDSVGNKSGTSAENILSVLGDVKKNFDLIGDQSVNPELIANHPNLDEGAKEELMRANSSEGLAQQTVDDLIASTPHKSILSQYTGQGYSGSIDLNSIVNNDTAAKEQKQAEQGQQVTNPAQEALGFTGEIGSFASDFNLLKGDDQANTQHKKGGQLNAEPAANLLTEYNQGGSHEANPHGGIPVGQNSQGGMNLVEQGETRHGDYIYSNEFELSKEDAQRFNLNPSYIGKSYSDISRDINDQIKTRPYDRLVKRTAEGNLNKLMMAQETLRQQDAADSNPDQQFMFGGMTETVAGAVGQINDAGGASQWLAQNGKQQGQGVSGAGIAGAAGTLLNVGNQMFGDTGIETNGTAGYQQKGNTAMGALGGAASGAAAGASFGPIGMGVGAVVGGLGGLIGGNRKNKDIQEANRNAALVENNKFRTEDVIAAKGGLLDTHLAKGGNAGPGDPPGILGSGMFDQKAWQNIGQSIIDGMKTKNRWHNNVAPELRGVPGPDIQPRISMPTEVVKTTTAPKAISKPTVQPEVSKPKERLRVPEGMTDLEAAADVSLTERGNRPAKTKPAPAGYDFYNDPDGLFVTEEEKAKAKMDADRAAYNQEQLDMYEQDAQSQLDTYNAAQQQQEFELLAKQLENTQNTDAAVKALQGLQNTNDVGLANSLSSNTQAKTSAEQAEFLKANPDAAANRAAEDSGLRGFQPSELMRYAPTVGNLIQLATLKDPEVETYDRLDNRYKPQYADEMAMQNIVSQGAANTRSAIQQASGGSQAAARASLLGSQVNEQRALSEAYMQMDGINRGENEKAQQFNLGVDQYNQQVDTQETIANAQNRAARETQKQSLLQGALNDMGEMGREAKLSRMLENVSGGYKSDGTKRGAEESLNLWSQMAGMFNKKKEDGGLLDVARELFPR